METHQHQPSVDFITYETINPAQMAENQLKLSLVYLDEKKLNNEDWQTSIGVRIEFAFYTEAFSVIGKVSQINDIKNRHFEKVEDFTLEETQQLMMPLLHLIETLVYDISEVALDKPGVVIDFTKMQAMDSKEIVGDFKKGGVR